MQKLINILDSLKISKRNLEIIEISGRIYDFVSAMKNCRFFDMK